MADEHTIVFISGWRVLPTQEFCLVPLRPDVYDRIDCLAKCKPEQPDGRRG